jgi:hypothetical protein
VSFPGIELTMTLALILGVCSLLAASTSNWPVGRASLVFQVAPQQNVPPSEAPQNPVQPAEQKPGPLPKQTPPATSAPSVEKTPSASQSQKTKTKTAAASKLVPKKRRPRKKLVTPPASDGPTKVIVKNGGASDPTVQLSPGVSPETASRQRQSTSLLLSTTENNLNATAGRQLSSSQKDTVTQVREYMKQAKASADAGDSQRAHNLAFKAKLLSDELAKH